MLKQMLEVLHDRRDRKPCLGQHADVHVDLLIQLRQSACSFLLAPSAFWILRFKSVFVHSRAYVAYFSPPSTLHSFGVGVA